MGEIHITVDAEKAPITAKNFTDYVEEGFFDGTIFHRVIPNFMVQGGDPTESGRGGESIWGKAFKDEFTNLVFDKPGILAMANAGRNTNGSQFFITTIPTPWLNGRHTIFGKIAPSSMSILMRLNNTQTGYGDKPLKRQEIIKAYIKDEGK